MQIRCLEYINRFSHLYCMCTLPSHRQMGSLSDYRAKAGFTRGSRGSRMWHLNISRHWKWEKMWREEQVGGGAGERQRRGGPQERAPGGLDNSYFFSSLLILPFPFSRSLSLTVKAQHLRRRNYCDGEDERSERLEEEKGMLENEKRTF